MALKSIFLVLPVLWETFPGTATTITSYKDNKMYGS